MIVSSKQITFLVWLESDFQSHNITSQGKWGKNVRYAVWSNIDSNCPFANKIRGRGIYQRWAVSQSIRQINVD